MGAFPCASRSWGSRFSKVPISTGREKQLLLFTFKIEASIVLHAIWCTCTFALFIWVSIYLARKYLLGTLSLRLLLETGPPLYLVIRATRRSCPLQGKCSTFISQLFLRPWVLVRPQGSNSRPRALQSNAVPALLTSHACRLFIVALTKTQVLRPFSTHWGRYYPS